MPEPEPAEVDVVGSLKGGVGKTRLAILMALYMHVVYGETVALLDADSVSQTANDWRRDYERKTQEPFPIKVIRHPFDDIDEEIERLRHEVDRVVVDVGGGNVNVFTAALKWANKLVVPIGADPSEVRRLRATWKAAAAAAGDSEVGGFDSWVMLARTDHTSSLPTEYRRILTGRDPETGERDERIPEYPLLDAEMRKAVAYQRAYATVPPAGGYGTVPDVLGEIGIIKKEVV